MAGHLNATWPRASLAVVLALLVMRPILAQMPWPLKGQQTPPPGGPTAVNVDVVLESIRAINSVANSWNGVHWVHLSWIDARAGANITAATVTWGTKSPPYQPDDCKRPCATSAMPSAGCCDTIWLPHVEANNLVALSQEADYRWRIWVDTNTSTVHWTAKITAEWTSPFDFRAWPFEHQHLLMELQITADQAKQVYLVMASSRAIANTPTAKGDALPGWYIAKSSTHLFNSTQCFSQTKPTSFYDTTQGSIQPLQPGDWAQVYQGQDPKALTNWANVSSDTCEVGYNTAATAQYSPHILVMDIMVRRTPTYYVLANILPLLLLDYMVFITYAMARSDLESRMTVVVTLVLAVSALQFTYNFPPASYLNAVQQITLMSYVLFFVVAVEAMISSHIHRMHSKRRNLAKTISMAAKRHNTPPIGPRWSTGGVGDMPEYAEGSMTVPSASIVIKNNKLPTGEVEMAVGQPLGMNTAATSRSSTIRRDPSFNSQWENHPHTSVFMGARHRGPVAEGTESLADLEGRDSAALADEPRGHRGFVQRLSASIKPHVKSAMEGKAVKRAQSVVSRVVQQSRNAANKIDADEAYAQLIARRLDHIFCITLLTGFTITWVVLLIVNSQVGDHKLMLGDKPGNM